MEISRPETEEESMDTTPAPLFIIKEIPGEGISWVASQDLEPGIILIDEIPILHAPDWEDDEDDGESPISPDKIFCLTCGLDMTFLKNTKKCATCNWPVCSSTCEKMAVHADNECKLFSDHKINFPPSSPVTTKTLSYIILTIRGFGLKNSNEPLFQEMMKPQSGPQFECPKLNKDVTDCLEQFKNLFPAMEIDESECKMMVELYTFNSCASNYYAVHLWQDKLYTWSNNSMYLKTSRMNHSCIPNCSWNTGPFPDLKIRIRTAKKVAKDEPLTVSYNPSLTRLQGTWERQQYFQTELGFICKCPRCVDVTEMGTFMSAVTCKICGTALQRLIPDESGLLLPLNALNLNQETSQWKCTSCDKMELASGIIPQVDEIYAKIKKFPHEKNPEIPDNGEFEALCESIIKENNQTKFLYKNHWLLKSAEMGIMEAEANKFLDKKPVGHEKFLKLSRSTLTIQNFITPGLFEYNAMTQLCIYMAVMALAVKNAKGNKLEMANQYLELSLKYKKEVLDFFDHFEPPNDDKKFCTSKEAMHHLMINSETTLEIAKRKALAPPLPPSTAATSSRRRSRSQT